jgi:hypothetical protein
LRKTLEDEKTTHIHGLPELILQNCITNTDLQIQCNPHQNSNDILQRNRKINPKIYVEAQKAQNSQSNHESKQQC